MGSDFLKILFIYFWLGLHCCIWAFSSCGEQRLLSSCVAWSSHCGGFPCCRAWALGASDSVVVVLGLYCTGSIAVVHRLSYSVVCRIFSDHGSNLRLLHWQADSLPLSPGETLNI